MTQLEHFDRSVAVLTKAYYKDELEKGNCQACAVGNLCAAALNITPENCGWGVVWSEDSPEWQRVFCTNEPTDDRQMQRPEYYLDKAKEQIDATGYSWQDLARIEFAFETAHEDIDSEEARLAGLMAVVDVLANIHGIDLSGATAAKALFVKEAA